MTPEDVGKIFDKVDAQKKAEGVKGEKSGSIREILNTIVAAKAKQGMHRLSQASLKGAVQEIMGTQVDGVLVPAKIEPSQFSSIINGMFETEKDKDTGAVIVLANQRKAPKAHTPRVKKADAAKQPA